MVNKYIQDAGHGGTDPGAQANGHVEKVYTLEAAAYVNKRLKELGIVSSMTRTSDASLDSVPRTNRVKSSGAQICLSHHFNAGGGDGTETIHSIHANNKLATTIAKEIAAAGVRFRRVFSRKYGSGDYYFMHRLTGNVHTIIVEYEFLDGPNNAKLKNKAFREKLYEAVVKAVCKHEGVAYKAPGANTTQTPPKTPQPTAGTFYRVVTGSFTDKANANTRVNALKRKGFDSFLEAFKKDGKNYFRVVTGSFKEKKNANARIAELKKANFDSFIDVFKK